MEGTPSKRCRTNTNLDITVEHVLDNITFTEIKFKQLSNEERTAIIDEIHDTFGLDLNAEQLRAFRIAAEHFVSNDVHQMLMFVTGMGGSGKSHVIKAIVELCKWCGCLHELLLSAPTGCAAILIEGYTIHTLTFLPGKQTANNKEKLENIWAKVKYLILDETSMLSAEMLSQISEHISNAKAINTYNRDKPFRGVNVIFGGDMGQLRPVIESALYAYNLVNQPTVNMHETLSGQAGLFGAAIWRQLTHVVELK